MMDTQTQGDFILAHGEEHVQCPYNLAHIVTNARLIVHLDKCRRAYEKEQKEAGKVVEYKACRFNYQHTVYLPEIKHHEERCTDRYKVVDSIRYHNSEDFKKSQDDERKRKEKDSSDRHRHKHKHHDKDREKDRENRSDRHRDKGKDYNFSSSSSSRDKDKDRYNYKEKGGSSSSNSKIFKFEDDKRSFSKSRSKHKESKHKLDDDNIWGSDAEDWEADAQDGYQTAYQPSERLKNEVILYQPTGMSKSERKQYRMEQRQKIMKPDFPEDPYSERYPEDVDIKPFSKLELANKAKIKEEPRDWDSLPIKQERYRKIPPPKVAPIEIDLEKEDGECSEEEDDFAGEDPFS